MTSRTSRTAQRMRRFAGMLVATGLALGVPGTAAATTSVTSGLLRCSVTSLAPTLSRGALTGWATVTCNRATSIQVIVGVVEMDGSSLGVEDTLVPIRPLPVPVTVTGSLVNKAIRVSTGAVLCLSTEADREEYATKAMINLGGAVSPWDRTTPANNAFAC